MDNQEEKKKLSLSLSEDKAIPSPKSIDLSSVTSPKETPKGLSLKIGEEKAELTPPPTPAAEAPKASTPTPPTDIPPAPKAVPPAVKAGAPRPPVGAPRPPAGPPPTRPPAGPPIGGPRTAAGPISTQPTPVIETFEEEKSGVSALGLIIDLLAAAAAIAFAVLLFMEL